MTDEELLARIDERTLNTYKLMEKLESHQAEQNGYIRENMIACRNNSIWINVFRWSFSIIVAGLAALWTKLQGIW